MANGKNCMSDLLKLVKPAQSTLAQLPGPKETHLCLDTTLEFAITQPDAMEMALSVINALKGKHATCDK